MARINGKCVALCDLCSHGGECLDGFDTEAERKKCERMDPNYYAGVDHKKTGDELVTAERDNQVELGNVIARDLARWNNEELENSAISLLTGKIKHPTIWGDDMASFRLGLNLPMQQRRVIAGALICAQIDVDNLKYQILINEQKTAADALRGNKKG